MHGVGLDLNGCRMQNKSDQHFAHYAIIAGYQILRFLLLRPKQETLACELFARLAFAICTGVPQKGPACVADQRNRYEWLRDISAVLFETNQSRLFVIMLVINMRVLASYQVGVPDVCSAHRCRPSGYRPSFAFRVPAGEGLLGRFHNCTRVPVACT